GARVKIEAGRSKLAVEAGCRRCCPQPTWISRPSSTMKRPACQVLFSSMAVSLCESVSAVGFAKALDQARRTSYLSIDYSSSPAHACCCILSAGAQFWFRCWRRRRHLPHDLVRPAAAWAHGLRRGRALPPSRSGALSFACSEASLPGALLELPTVLPSMRPLLRDRHRHAVPGPPSLLRGPRHLLALYRQALRMLLDPPRAGLADPRRLEHRPVPPQRPQDPRQTPRHRHHGDPLPAAPRDHVAPQGQGIRFLPLAQDAPSRLDQQRPQVAVPLLSDGSEPPFDRGVLAWHQPQIRLHLVSPAETPGLVDHGHEPRRHDQRHPRRRHQTHDHGLLLAQL